MAETRDVIARALLSSQTAPEYALHMYPKADAILAALAAKELVIVPREPTDAMVAAWNGSDADDVNCPCDRQQRMKWMEGIDPDEWARSNATADWRAMLAAAGGDDD